MLVFTLVLANFFDVVGTMTGLGKEGGLADKDGNLPRIGKALAVEGVGAVAGGFGSVSSNTVFVESASGIAEGDADGAGERDHRPAVPGGDVLYPALPGHSGGGGGSGVGFLSCVLLQVFTGRVRTVHPLMWVVSAAFVLYFCSGLFSALFGLSSARSARRFARDHFVPLKQSGIALWQHNVLTPPDQAEPAGLRQRQDGPIGVVRRLRCDPGFGGATWLLWAATDLHDQFVRFPEIVW